MVSLSVFADNYVLYYRPELASLMLQICSEAFAHFFHFSEATFEQNYVYSFFEFNQICVLTQLLVQKFNQVLECK